MYNMANPALSGWDRSFITPPVCCAPGAYYENGKSRVKNSEFYYSVFTANKFQNATKCSVNYVIVKRSSKIFKN